MEDQMNRQRVNGITCYALQYLKDLWDSAWSRKDYTLAHELMRDINYHENVYGWVQRHLEDKIGDKDLLEIILEDINWQHVLQKMKEHTDVTSSIDTESDEE